MSGVSFENFGKLAHTDLSATERAGRYSVQAKAEKLIVADVTAKLGLEPDDDLLDIGCGSGVLLVPLSFVVRSATGVDHPAVIDNLRRSFPGAPIDTIAGNFMLIEIDATFSAIVIYSVAHYLSSKEELLGFVEKASGLLAVGGRLLLGDIPNVDKKRRFLQTHTGLAFSEAWQKSTKASSQAPFFPDPEVLQFDDQLVTDLVLRFRKRGFDAFVLPQNPELPFGWTREDVLIVRPPP